MVLIYGRGKFEAYREALHLAGMGSLVAQTPDDIGQCEALLLPGGGDIGDRLDDREYHLIEYCVRRGLPILGICRGMQALNVWFGGTLFDRIEGHQIPDGDMQHLTCAAPPLSRWLGEHKMVNSNHHQAVKRLGCGLRICQWARDGIAEGLVHKDLPILGVQWHPERMGRDGQMIFTLWKEWIQGERRP